jgi:hypothetical protein
VVRPGRPGWLGVSETVHTSDCDSVAPGRQPASAVGVSLISHQGKQKPTNLLAGRFTFLRGTFLVVVRFLTPSNMASVSQRGRKVNQVLVGVADTGADCTGVAVLPADATAALRA